MTPIQEVFAHLRASKEDDSLGAVMTARLVGYAVDWLLENEKSLLEKEKEVITSAYNKGKDYYFYNNTTMPNAEEYYNKTFNTKER
jgi:hypothetical protein